MYLRKPLSGLRLTRGHLTKIIIIKCKIKYQFHRNTLMKFI